jgi:hypothetical protein
VHTFCNLCNLTGISPLPTLTAYVANCLIGGEEVTHNPDGSWIRDIVRFNCGGRVFCFHQRADVARGETQALRGHFCETTTVEVENVTEAQLGKVLEILDAICWLLSFATQSHVVKYGYNFPKDSINSQFSSVSGVANDFRPPLDPRDTTSVKRFIEQTYPTYRLIQKKRKLAAIFDYLIQSDRMSQPTEIRLLILFVTLENIKDTYARGQNIPYIKGFFRKQPINPGKSGAKYSFEDLLLEALQSVRMRKGLKQVISLRNEIIHSGLSRKSHSRQMIMFERVQDLVREYIFRLLGYRGDFFTYASQGMAIRKV